MRRRAARPSGRGPRLALALALAACGGEKLPVEELQDPVTCQQCHPRHVEQWSGSMHAYAADDPVFIAMNRRGQRETGGALGDFCFRCHAPMARQLGFTDFAGYSDPEVLPRAARGITCYFCHNVEQVTTTHGNGLVLANDQTMRGGARDPVDTPAHHSKYDRLMDSDVNASELCGSCHDIVVPASINGTRDVAVERTFLEWKATFFATEADSRLRLSCGSCHLESARLEPIADAPGVKAREFGFHDHTMAGIDVALTPFPRMAEQLAAVHDILDPSVRIVGAVRPGGSEPTGGICVEPTGRVTVRVDSIGVGHAWPSGAAQDRRAWVEVIAYDDSGGVVFQSGVVPPGMDPEVADPALLQEGALAFWDRTFKADNTPAHFFWEIDRVDPRLLPAPSFPGEDVSKTRIFPVANPSMIARVTARFRFNPLPYALLDDLIASGDLAPAVRDQVRTLEVGQPTVWLREEQNPATGCNDP